MAAKNLSIARLERQTGLTIYSVRNILTGKIKRPSAHSLHAIAKALDCSIIDLMDESSIDSNKLGKKIKKGSPLNDPELLFKCCKAALGIIQERQLDLSLEDSLDIIKKAYLYSSGKKPSEVELKFLNWLISQELNE